jgi:histidinol-phosphate aminotransferase
MTIKNIDLIIPDYIKKLDLYQPGRLIEDVMREMGLSNVVKLASNENSLGPSPLAVKAISGALQGLSRYGDADSRHLREVLAQREGIPVEGVLAGNGSSEFILVMAHALLGPGLTAVMSKPSFTLYAKNAQAAGAKVIEVPLDDSYGHDLKAITAQVDSSVRLVFIDNPVNPTGAYLEPGQIKQLLDSLPETTLLVLDEAYADFIRHGPRPDYVDLQTDGRLVVLRTCSKLMGLAGLRAAWALMDPDLAQALNKVRQPFNLNTLAQIGAIAALGDHGHIVNTLVMTWNSLKELAEVLPTYGLTVYPTEANFLMARLPEGHTANDFTKKMLKEGVIVRSLSSFGLSNHVRINAGQPSEMSVLFKAIGKCLSRS